MSGKLCALLARTRAHTPKDMMPSQYLAIEDLFAPNCFGSAEEATNMCMLSLLRGDADSFVLTKYQLQLLKPTCFLRSMM